jgi:hypothetical protein
LRKCDPAISGQGGHAQTFKIACKLVKGFALPGEDAYQLLLREFNPRCQPPWSERELRHKIDDAAKSSGASGYMLDQNEWRVASDELREKPAASSLATRHSPLATRPKLPHARCFTSIEPLPIEWLWPGWIPLGKVTMLDGDPGLGKSTLLLDLAARVSSHGIMPDGKQGIAGHVLIMSAEDADEDTIKPRLVAAGATHERVHSFTHLTDANGKDRPPEIPKDLEELEALIAAKDVRLLIIDPLLAFLCGADANKDQEVRRVLFRLSRIAAKYRCAIVCMRHLNKTNSTKAIYRGNTSIGVIGHARTGLLVGVDPDDQHKRVLAVSKCNLAAKPKSLRFAVEPVDNVCRIGWCGTAPYSADDLLQAPLTEAEREEQQQALTRLEQCTELLLDLIRPGPKEIKQCKEECNAAGFSLRTIERAAHQLKLRMIRESGEGKNIYLWELS